MKILLVTPYPPTRDGIGTYAALFHAELVAQGHEVRVVAARAEKPAAPEVIGGLRGTERRPEPELLETIATFAPDVVHVQFAIAGYAGSVFAVLRLMRRFRERGYPVVATLHEVTRDTASLGVVGRALYRVVAARLDLAIVHTDVARACLETLRRDLTFRTEVIAHPHAVLPDADTTPEELRSRFGLADASVILAFGFIDVDKGLQDLIRAVGLVLASSAAQDVRLVIAGAVRRRYGLFRVFELRDRAYLAYLRRIVRRDRLSDVVVFAGYVPEGSMRSWFKLAALAVLPYRRSEQSGVANLARSAGTPLVTTAVGELASLSAVPAVPPRNPGALASALQVSLAHPVADRDTNSTVSNLDAIVAQTVAAYAKLHETSAA